MVVILIQYIRMDPARPKVHCKQRLRSRGLALETLPKAANENFVPPEARRIPGTSIKNKASIHNMNCSKFT